MQRIVLYFQIVGQVAGTQGHHVDRQPEFGDLPPDLAQGRRVGLAGSPLDAEEVARFQVVGERPAHEVVGAVPGDGVVAVVFATASAPGEGVIPAFHQECRIVVEGDRLVGQRARQEGGGDADGPAQTVFPDGK